MNYFICRTGKLVKITPEYQTHARLFPDLLPRSCGITVALQSAFAGTMGHILLVYGQTLCLFEPLAGPLSSLLMALYQLNGPQDCCCRCYVFYYSRLQTPSTLDHMYELLYSTVWNSPATCLGSNTIKWL